jgi:anti-anti-sigma factor
VISVSTARRTIIISLAGEFDLATATALRISLQAALAGEWRAIVVECSEVTFLDLVGGRPLWEASAAAGAAGVSFFLVHPREHVATVLDLLELGHCVVRLEKLPRPAQVAVRLALQRTRAT